MTDESWFDPQRFERLRAEAGASWGRPVRVLDRVESTSDLALDAVTSDARTGIVWVAREQTRGRGRRGNTWVARPGESLLMSVLLRWPAPPRTTTGLGLAVGLAVLRACQGRVSARPLALKWPNDVVCQGSKLAGILIESRSDGPSSVGIVLGIGINVSSVDFEAAAGRATSLALIGAQPPALDLEPLLLDVLIELERVLTRVLSGKWQQVMGEVRAVDALIGRHVRIDDAGAELVGLARGISDSGELELETSSGLRLIASGHVIAD